MTELFYFVAGAISALLLCANWVRRTLDDANKRLTRATEMHDQSMALLEDEN